MAVTEIKSWFASHFPRPWSVAKTFCIAAAVGAMSPILSLFLMFPVRMLLSLAWPESQFASPVVLSSLLAIQISLLYWRAERGRFRTDRPATLATVCAGMLWMLGAVGSGWCCIHHICMGGHMAHPPYPPRHYIFDAGWVTCLVATTIWMLRVRTPAFIAFTFLTTFLLSYRFVFGSFGGIFVWLPL